MNEYEFGLKFDLPNPRESADLYSGSLYDANCDDALIGSGILGRIALDFIREASSAEGAVYSAIDNVLHAIPGATLTEASPDLVCLTDLAHMIGCSRQNLRKYYVGDVLRAERFPAPAFAGKTALWHLAKAGEWLNQYSDLCISPNQLEVARIAFAINSERDHKDLRKMA